MNTTKRLPTLICMFILPFLGLKAEDIELEINQEHTFWVSDAPNYSPTAAHSNVDFAMTFASNFEIDEKLYSCTIKPTKYFEGTAELEVSWQESENMAQWSNWVTKRYTWYITVKYIPITGISIPSSVSVVADQTSQPLSLTLTPSNGSVESKQWESENSGVATVNSNGEVTGVWPGTTRVYCTVNGKRSNACEVTVTEPSFSFKSFSINDGATGVDTRPNIVATFSHAISRSSQFDKIALTDSKGQKVSGNVSINGTKLTFTPAKHLQPLSAYTLTIPANAVQNKWGTDYASAKTVSFTTADWKQMTLTAEPAYKFVNRGDQITLKASTSEAEILYSIDGSQPTKRYTGPLTFEQDMTVKAIARQDGYYDSPLFVKDYLQCVEIVERFPSDEPLYIYADVNPSITYTNRISASQAFKDIRLLKDGTESIPIETILYEKTITFVPTKPLELGYLYVLSMPEGAVVTERGEENKAMDWRFATGNFPCAVSTGGQELAAAIKTDGSLWTWGMQLTAANAADGSYSYTTVAKPTMFVSEDVTAVSSGLMHHALLKKDGSLWMWGRQLCGEFGNDSRTASAKPIKILDGVKAVSCGMQNTAIIKSDGTLWMCGRNDFGQVGNGSRETVTAFVKVMDDVRVAAVGGYSSYAIKQDGTLWQWGGINAPQLTPRQLMTQVQTVSVSGESTTIIKTDGTLWTWTEREPTPVQMLAGMAEAAAGDGSYLGIKADGSLWAWGRNDYGQLGNSQTTDAAKPVAVMDDVTNAQYGWKNAIALREDGSVWTWGLNGRGALGDGTTIGTGIYSATPSEVIEGRMPLTLAGISLPTETLPLGNKGKMVIPMRPIPLRADYEDITWTIDNPNIAEVSERGVVTAKASGLVTVTATIKGKTGSFKAECKVEVGAVGITNPQDEWTLCVSALNKEIRISGVPIGEMVSIHDLAGIQMFSGRMNNPQMLVPIRHHGIYIVNAGRQVRKIVVN